MQVNQDFIESALKGADLIKSPHTGFLHHCYESTSRDTSSRDTVPLYENYCYVLALFRSHQVNNFKAGRELLSRLLHFFTENGPTTYLHDYPQVKSRSGFVHFLPIFYWIRREFHAMLGEALEARFENAFQILLTLCNQHYPELPQRTRVKIDGFYGRNEGFDFIPESSEQWANYLIALQMGIEENPELADYLPRLAAVYEPTLARYTGLSLHEKQKGFAPAKNFFHLAMNFFAGGSSQDFPPPLLVHYALLRESEPLHNLLAAIPPTNFWVDRAPSHPIRCFFGSYSLVCEDFKGSVSLTQSENRTNYLLTLPQEELPWDEDTSEINLYTELPAIAKITINGKRASVFKLGDHVALECVDGRTITLIFTLNSGEGRFMGHLAQGNRHSQNHKCPDDPFKAHDWKIFLRTISRTPSAQITLSLSN